MAERVVVGFFAALGCVFGVGIVAIWVLAIISVGTGIWNYYCI